MKKYTEIKVSSINSVLVRSELVDRTKIPANSILEEYVKAEVAERLYIALEQMVSITTIAQREYGEKFAWAELECAFEAIKHAEEN